MTTETLLTLHKSLITEFSVIDICVYKVLHEVGDVDGDSVGVFRGANRRTSRHQTSQGPTELSHLQDGTGL